MRPIRLTPAHKMTASAVLVAVVIVGGASVTAAAFAGRLDDVAKVGDAPAVKILPADSGRDGFAGPRTTPGADPGVVSEALTNDPDEVAGYWTPERMEDARPMPMPEISVTIIPD